MTTTNNPTFQLRAHEQNVWEYINPKATNSNVPRQRSPVDEAIMTGQMQGTDSDVHQEYPDRFAEHFMAANESEEVRRGCLVLRRWIHSTVDTRVLCAGQEIAAGEGGSLQAVVRALPGQLPLPKRKVMQSFFSLKTKSPQELDLLMKNTNFDASHTNEASAGGADSSSLKTTTSHKTYWNPRSILALLKRTKANTKSSLLKLPNGLLLNIVKRLELHDEFILGQTCKAFRTIVQKDWNVVFNCISLARKQIFLTGVAFISPDHWVCGVCDKLHRLEKDDVPWQKPWRKARSHCLFDRKGSFDRNGAIFGALGFEIEERHVQLALKLTRLKNVNQKYLNKIMAPFSDEFNSDRSQKSEYFRASPKIIRERFILYTQRDIVYEAGLTLDSCDWQEICPHMVVYSNDDIHDWFSGPKNFSNDVRTALSQFYNEITGHCPRCPTDYAITAGPNGMRIQAWKDFGSYKSPKDESWTVHVWSQQNSRTKGPIMHHDPGSIRKLRQSQTTTADDENNDTDSGNSKSPLFLKGYTNHIHRDARKLRREGTYLVMVVSSWFHLSREATQPSSHVKAGDFCWVPTTHPPV
ncbi:hypothetical protein K456DRAFT_38952 [Colletotrichum gloeosporioides 23]|nr:hypothetical protein K456DRAFT_38952 [Colletotrichum gloeosporioides 23]